MGNISSKLVAGSQTDEASVSVSKQAGLVSIRRSVVVGIAAAMVVTLGSCSSSTPTDSATEAIPSPADESTSSEPTVDDTAQQGSTETNQDEFSTSEDEGASEDDAVIPQATQTLPSRYLDSYTLDDAAFGTQVNVTVDGDSRTIETNALPDHETGDFPTEGNPNEISAQSLTWELPIAANYTGEARPARTSGVAVNGVKFEPGTAETISCGGGETYRIEAIQDIYNLGLDFNNAHVQPTGEYHYHGISKLLVDAYASEEDLVHVGFALDGHLIYYSKSGAFEPGYQLGDELRSGRDCVASYPGGSDTDVEGMAPDGTYTSDWVFDAANGDLDQCNGTTIDGQYVYMITDSYPYISRCLNGEFTEAGGGGRGQRQGRGQGQRQDPDPGQDQG